MRHRTLSTSQAAKLLGVSDQSIANWIDQGKLRAGRTPGGHRKIEVEAFVEFLRQQGLPIPTELGPGKAKILIVDDEEQVVGWMAAILKSKLPDCQILTAMDGFSAGELVATERPGIVLLDLFMPNLDGFEVCRRIKANPLTRDTHVVAISAHLTIEAAERIRQAGASLCISKPIEAQSLVEAVKSFMD